MSKAAITLAALMLVTFVLGSVHAFSVLLAPLEAKLGLPRAQISLVYSFALVAITLSVTVGYRIYAALAAWWLVSSLRPRRYPAGFAHGTGRTISKCKNGFIPGSL